ncbi:MAG: hypothetical protein PHY45_08515 [Rhodocyclaceae bacterium]|nr:hypothetical protein [Rhodocyclaceae bacterium]
MSTTFPDFYAAAPVVTMRDPLAAFLGAAADGIIDYRYEDAVRLAGHSCPTVASAFVMVRAALKALYGEELPRRGEIGVDLRDARDSGVTGVIAAVATLITGAADAGGFKGLGGRFARCQRLAFGRDIPGTMRLTRLDSGAAATVAARLDGIPGDPRMGALLPRCLDGSATAAEAALFGELWQARVRCLLLDHADDPAVVLVQLQ